MENSFAGFWQNKNVCTELSGFISSFATLPFKFHSNVSIYNVYKAASRFVGRLTDHFEF